MYQGVPESPSDAYQLPELSEQDELMKFPVPDVLVRSSVHHPVARVLVDAPGAYWGATFDYEVPEELDQRTRIGCRVRVGFGHKKVDGFVVRRLDQTQHAGQLKPIEKVVSSFCALDPGIYRLCSKVAQEQACTIMDVVRCAVPARHARAERSVLSLPSVRYPQHSAPYSGVWNEYDEGARTLQSLVSGHIERRFCDIAPAHTYAQLLSGAIQSQLVNSRTVLIIAPTPRETYALASELRVLLHGEPIITMSSDVNHEQRYRNFVGVAQGRARVVIGTRSACFAPMKNLGLLALIDPAHPAHREQRIPYYSAVHVLEQRADMEECSLLVCGRGPDVYAAYQERSGLVGSRIRLKSQRRRECMPRIFFSKEIDREGAIPARIPDSMFTVVRKALKHGHVLVVVPRSGYIPVLLCMECGKRIRCALCQGALEIRAPHEPAQCIRCAVRVHTPQCQHCGSRNIKALRIGSLRTAQEIGRAFLGVPIVAPHRAAELSSLPPRPSIIVATPGSIPALEKPYAAAVLLDMEYVLQANSLDAESRALRMIAHVAHNVRLRSQGGELLIVGDLPHNMLIPARSLIWNEWENSVILERDALHLPPSATWISCEGQWPQIKEFLALVRMVLLHSTHRSDPIHANSCSSLSDVEKSAYASESAEIGDTQAPLDALLGGGVHSLIPYMAVLGPHQRNDGTMVIYLRCEHKRRKQCIRAIRRALQEASIRRVASHVRVHVNPPL